VPGGSTLELHAAMHLTLAHDRYRLQLQANGRTQHTLDQADRHVRVLYRWMIRELGGTELALLGHEEVARFLTSDDATKRPDGAPKKPTSLNALRSTIRAFFAFTAAAGITPGNPAALVRRAIVSDPVPRALSGREVERLREQWGRAATASDRRDRVLFELLLRTGLRIGSALGLEVGDVDLDERKLWVRVAKRGRQQVVGFDGELAVLLGEHIGERSSGWLFQSVGGAPLASRSVQRRLQGWVRKAGSTRAVSQHQLRHTFAATLYSRTRDIEVVRIALGHSSLAVTSRYARYANEVHAR